MDVNCPSCKSLKTKRALQYDQGLKTVMFCSDCNLGFVYPQKSKEEKEGYYEQQYYNSHKLNFDPERNVVYKNDFSKISKGLHAGRLLDVGCGFGHFLVLAKESGWECVGIDPAEQAVKIARERYHCVMSFCGGFSSFLFSLSARSLFPVKTFTLYH
jgi:SAM-dependent methyltransferase